MMGFLSLRKEVAWPNLNLIIIIIAQSVRKEFFFFKWVTTYPDKVK